MQSDVIVIPLYHFYNVAEIKAEHLKQADRQLLQAVVSTGEYEVGLCHVYMENYYWELGSYISPHAYSTHPLTSCYVGWTKLENGKQAFMSKPVNLNNDINTVKAALAIKDGKYISFKENFLMLYETPYIEEGDDVTGEYKFLQCVMIIRKIKNH